MRIFPNSSGFLWLTIVTTLSISLSTGFPLGKRLYRSLPSVSDDHYSETYPDGTYKYAYTGQDRYTAERRFRDGTVEGESLYIRPDGVPVKVHYFADSKGYRPKNEVLYAERVVAARTLPDVIYKDVEPGVVLARPIVRSPYSTGSDVEVRLNENGKQLAVGNSGGGDVALAQPSVTAIVGPGGHADIRPEAVARTDGNNRYFGRSAYSRGGDAAIANPSVNAIVGPGASVSISPRATALTGSAGISDHPPVVVQRDIHHHPVTQVVKEVHHAPPPPPVVHHVVRPVVTQSRGGYVYAAPPPPPPAVPLQVPVGVRVPLPEVTAVRANGVVIVPPRPSYEYSYGYSSPDEKHPAYGPNSAFVNVRVNN